jgi:hypothetical protein
VHVIARLDRASWLPAIRNPRLGFVIPRQRAALSPEFAFAHSRSMILRTIIAVAFALPAAVAGYHLVLGVTTMGMPSDMWRHVFAIIGAAVVGSTAWARLVCPPSGESAADPALPQA